MNEDNNIEFFEDEIEFSSTLSELEGVNSFRVPVGYFNDLEKDIIQKVENSQARIKTFSIFRKVLYYAAAASVIFVLGYMVFNIYAKDKKSKIVKTDNVEQSIQIIDKNNKENITNTKNSLGKNVDTANSNLQIVEHKKASLNIDDKTIIPNSTDNKNINTQQKNNSIEVANEDIDNSINNNDIENNSNNNDIENNSNAIALNSSQNINNNTSSTSAISARKGRKPKANTFLPADTCVNKPFVYNIKSLKTQYPKWSFQWEGEKLGANCYVSSSKSYILHFWMQDSISLYDTMKVHLIEKPNPRIEAPDEICSHDSVTLNAGINSTEYDYYWSVSSQNSSEIHLDNLKTGKQIISLKVTSCIDTVETSFVLNVINCDIDIPNVFTPNGDGYNDAFVIKGLDKYPGSSITILDRNGKLVYQSTDYKNDWKAVNLPAGTYFYSLILNDGNNTERGGVLSIIK